MAVDVVWVAWAGSRSSNLTPGLENSISYGCGPKKKEKKKKLKSKSSKSPDYNERNIHVNIYYPSVNNLINSYNENLHSSKL